MAIKQQNTHKEIIKAIYGDLITLMSKFQDGHIQKGYAAFVAFVKSPSITSTAAANILVSQYEKQSYFS